jgi:hypothetical protein
VGIGRVSSVRRQRWGKGEGGRRKKEEGEYRCGHAAASSVRYRAWARARARVDPETCWFPEGPSWQRRNVFGLSLGRAGPTVGPGGQLWIMGRAVDVYRAAVREVNPI